MTGMLRALWTYRGFILGSVKREFQVKYRIPCSAPLGQSLIRWP